VSPTVLLIEDDAPLLGLLGLAIEGWGHRVVQASDAKEAVRRACEERRIDLVVADVGVVERADEDVVGRIRAEHPQSRRVFMSGYRPPRAEPNEPFLLKPFSLEALEELMREALDA
jgi:DNA-binding NtrC family response regulator